MIQPKIETAFQAQTFFNWLSGEVDEDYLLSKTCEELTELQELLLKTINKDAKHKPAKEKIIEEIGDVEFRLRMLRRKLAISYKDIENRKIYKANQLVQLINNGKKTNRI